MSKSDYNSNNWACMIQSGSTFVIKVWQMSCESHTSCQNRGLVCWVWSVECLSQGPKGTWSWIWYVAMTATPWGIRTMLDQQDHDESQFLQLLVSITQVPPPSSQSADQPAPDWSSVTELGQEVSVPGLGSTSSVLEWVLLSCYRAWPSESGPSWSCQDGPSTGLYTPCWHQVDQLCHVWDEMQLRCWCFVLSGWRAVEERWSVVLVDRTPVKVSVCL